MRSQQDVIHDVIHSAGPKSQCWRVLGRCYSIDRSDQLLPTSRALAMVSQTAEVTVPPRFASVKSSGKNNLFSFASFASRLQCVCSDVAEPTCSARKHFPARGCARILTTPPTPERLPPVSSLRKFEVKNQGSENDQPCEQDEPDAAKTCPVSLLRASACLKCRGRSAGSSSPWSPGRFDGRSLASSRIISLDGRSMKAAHRQSGLRMRDL